MTATIADRQRSVCLEDARVFMSLAGERAAAAQIEALIDQRCESLAVWLQAALLEGHFDVPPPPGYGISPRTLAAKALQQLLVTPHAQAEDPDPETDPFYGALDRIDSEFVAEYKAFAPFTAPDIECFLMALAQRIEETSKAWDDDFQRRRALGANLHVVWLLAIALDLPGVVQRLQPHLQGQSDALVPHEELRFEPNPVDGDLLHPAAVALHYGSCRVLAEFLDNSPGTLPGGWTYSDDSDERVPFSMALLLRGSHTRLHRQALTLLCKHLQVQALTDIERQDLGAFTDFLVQRTRCIEDWETVVLSTGLVDMVSPAQLFLLAARVSAVRVLEHLKDCAPLDETAWSQACVSHGHLALVSAGSQPMKGLKLPAGGVDRALDWFFDRAVEQGGGALQTMFAACDSDGESLGTLLVARNRQYPLSRAMELGLDPLVCHEGQRLSAMEAAQNLGCTEAQELMLSFVARARARQVAQDLSFVIPP